MKVKEKGGGEGKKERGPLHLGREGAGTGSLLVRLSVLGYVVNQLCGKTPFPKRQSKLFVDTVEEKGWARTCKTYDLSQNLEG